MAISQAKKLEIITKHGKKFATKSEKTPVLQGVHYSADGSVVVTDRHRLLRIGGAHNFAEPFTSHVVTGAPIDGRYPDTARVIPMELPTQITLTESDVRSDVKDAIARVKLAVDSAKVVGDAASLVLLSTAGGLAKIHVNDDEKSIYYTASIGSEIYGDAPSVSLNSTYLLDALNVFKDAGSKRVIIGLTGEASPVVLRDEENEIDAVILPYRVPK